MSRSSVHVDCVGAGASVCIEGTVPTCSEHFYRTSVDLPLARSDCAAFLARCFGIFMARTSCMRHLATSRLTLFGCGLMPTSAGRRPWLSRLLPACYSHRVHRITSYGCGVSLLAVGRPTSRSAGTRAVGTCQRTESSRSSSVRPVRSPSGRLSPTQRRSLRVPSVPRVRASVQVRASSDGQPIQN